MSKTLLVILLSALLAACAAEAPNPTGPIEVPVFHQSHEDDDGDDEDDDDESNGRSLRARLSGREEVPQRETRARGKATFRLNRAGTELRYQLQVSKIRNVVQAHIHLGAVGVNGPIVVWLYPSTTSTTAGPAGQGRFQGVIARGVITQAHQVGPLAGEPFSALLNALRNGNAYVNVHTNDGEGMTNTGPGDFPGGEIRGQVREHGEH